MRNILSIILYDYLSLKIFFGEESINIFLPVITELFWFLIDDFKSSLYIDTNSLSDVFCKHFLSICG